MAGAYPDLFERRIKVLLYVLAAMTVGVVVRLVQLQVLRADTYREEARRALLRPIRLLPCVRGQILDRTGHVLAENRPCWDVCVPYGILAAEPEYLNALAEQIKLAVPGTRGRVTEADVDELRSRISAMWPAIAEATGVGLDAIAEQRERIVQRVRCIKDVVRQKQGLDRRIAEERLSHPIVRGLSQEAAVRAGAALSAYRWVEVTAGTQRHYADEPSLAHVLGRLEDLGTDAVFAQEMTGELHGVAGVERLAEDWLRGTPGQIAEDIDGKPVAPPIEPRDGANVRLTIDAVLQQQIYERLDAAVRQYPLCSGAAAVVLDAAGREVLAAVSFPGFNANATATERRRLAIDRKALPLRSRALSELYPPGSTVKPLVAAVALADGIVTPETEFDCQGRLFAEGHAFRCTGIHGSIALTMAISRSCNVYFFRLGELMTVPRLRQCYEAVGFGIPAGTALREDVAGRLPERTGRGDARNTAIGQGELAVTPLHVANLMATIATGEYRAATVVLDDPRERPARSLGVSGPIWALVRTGMHNVVNEPGGTAYGKLDLPPEPWVLLGKTGSAEAWPRELDRLYTIEWPDGGREEYVATDAADVKRRLAGRGEFRIAGWKAHNRWPPAGQQIETHGWFAGYMIRREDLARLGESPRRAFAIAVLLEYAGHGGAVAAPVAGEVAQMITARYGS